MKTLLLGWMLAGLCLGAGAAEQPHVTGAMEGPVLTAGARRVMILDQGGRVHWEHKTEGLPHDAWLLPGGNILYADGATVTELTPAHAIVWQYRPAPNKGGGAFACQRLAGGNTLVGENSTGRVLEVDPRGKIVFSLQTAPFTPGNHHNLRMARKLEGGNYLVCHSGAHVVREYTPAGGMAREFKVDNLAFSAIRTPRDTTLVGCLGRIVEFDADGKTIWEFKVTDIPGVTIANICGINLLPGGRIAAGCYQAYDARGRGNGLFEITRDKKLVWRYADPQGKEGTMMPIQMLSPAGTAAASALR